jgi:uncharacterized protein (DUF2342 family)
VYAWLVGGVTSGIVSHRRAAEAVVRLARDSYAPSRAAEDESSYFDDAFDLAERKIDGTIEKVASELEAHLKQYAA